MAAPKKAVGPKSDKLWREAIRKAVHELVMAEGEGIARRTKALRLLARKLVSKGLKGDVAALKEIGDRLDGRARQEIELDMPVQVTEIVRKIIVPKDEAAEATPAASNGTGKPAGSAG